MVLSGSSLHLLHLHKNESFQLFEGMLDSLRETVSQQLSRIRPMSEEEQQKMLAEMAARQAALQGIAPAPEQTAEGEAAPGFVEDDPTTWGTPSRNDKCPCGSGQKFKHCRGRLA